VFRSGSLNGFEWSPQPPRSSERRLVAAPALSNCLLAQIGVEPPGELIPVAIRLETVQRWLLPNNRTGKWWLRQYQPASRSRAHTNGRTGRKTYSSWGSQRMNARLFETTETLEKAIAAPASAGLSRPMEATGMSVAL
jgi:hypothetical protein